MTISKVQRITGALFTVLGVYVAFYSFAKLGVGTMRRPGPGLFTLICGAGIMIMSLMWLITQWKDKDETLFFEEKGAWIPPSLGVAITLIYALLITPLGYTLSTLVFIVLWQVVIARARLRTVILFGVIGSAVMFVLFELLLGVPLPNGFIGF